VFCFQPCSCRCRTGYRASRNFSIIVDNRSVDQRSRPAAVTAALISPATISRKDAASTCGV
jgi:hypothetical protein